MTACSSTPMRRPRSPMARRGTCATRAAIRPFRPSCGDRRRKRSRSGSARMSLASPAAVGGFVLGAIGIVVAAVLFFGGGNMFSPRTEAVVFFEGSVGGLASGASVNFRGVRVGSVSRVALVVDAADLKARIPVYLRLEPDQMTLVGGSGRQPMLHRLIEAGLRAKLVSQSLVTGQMCVE